MPTNRQKRSRASTSLDYWRLDQLANGETFLAGVGYGALASGGCNTWSETDWQRVRAAMVADWQEHGAAFLAWWRGETERFTAAYAAIGGKRRDPTVTPWALTEFGEPKEIKP